MNFVPVITHAVAILMGWLVVAFATLPNPVSHAPADGGRHDFLQEMQRSKPGPRPSPGSLLAAQSGMPMEPVTRTALKRRILAAWAATDPDGLLQYLEHRPWLIGTDNAANEALKAMALARPDDLLAYARREGCQTAISMLYFHGDPRVAMDRLLSMPPGVIHESVLAELFERGCQLDPTFHERLDAITDPGTRLTVFEAITRTLLASKRHDEFYPWLANTMDTLPAGSIAGIIADQLVAGRADVNELNRLPDAVRPHAIDATLRSLAGDRIDGDDSYQQACFTTFLKNGWLDRRLHLAAAVIKESYQGVPKAPLHPNPATTWKDWALEIPGDPKWDPLRRIAVRRWILESPDAWNTIADLPNQNLRNAAYTAVVHRIDLDRNGDRIPWILHQITDPALRNIALEVVTERMQGDPDKPLDIDPFQPLGAR